MFSFFLFVCLLSFFVVVVVVYVSIMQFVVPVFVVSLLRANQIPGDTNIYIYIIVGYFTNMRSMYINYGEINQFG